MANTKITSRVLADDAVNISNINTIDATGGGSSPSADGQALVAKNTVGTPDYYLDWATVSGTTINNNADNRIITGSGTANTLEGESNLTFDGSKLGIGSGTVDETIHVQVSSGDAAIKLEDASGDYIRIDQNSLGANDKIRFKSGSSLNEAARIDANGVLLVNRTSPVWGSSKFEVDSNARIGNIYLQGDSSNSIISAGNGQFKVSSLEIRGGGTGLDFDVTLIKTGVGFTNMFKVDSPSGDTYTNDGTISSLSDERIKTDINDLADGLDIVKQLRPVTFKYNDTTEDEDGKKEMGYADDTVRYGFIAQEVEAVAPQYVETSTRKINNEEVDDFKSMSTTRMIPMLFKAIQELETRVKELEG